MGKQFKSLNEAIKYIKSAQTQASKAIGREVEDIVRDTTKENLYDSYSPESYKRTYDMMNMIRMTESTTDSVTVAIEDTGGHTSWNSPHPHVFVAPILEEGGHTWERDGGRKPPTRIIEDSTEKAEDVAPETYIKAMASRGIKVNRK